MVSIAVLIAILTSDCGKDPCAGDVCDTGGGGQGGNAGEGGQGGDGGAGGIVVTGSGGSGSEGGGSGGSGGQGGAGGTTTTSGNGGGGDGGGPCVPTFACGPKDCGMVDDGCGKMLNCDDPGFTGEPSCKSQFSNQDQNGPMTCNMQTHACECVPEGNTPPAMALCDGEAVQIGGVAAFCKESGGCSSAFCGIPPVPKVPEHCRYAGEVSGQSVWCCVNVPS